MKELITLFFSISQLILIAQFNSACLPEGILFSSQAEIDDFPINSAGCEVIMGNVKISGPDITNLNGLSTIKIIEGNLWFHKNISLVGLNGLENLTTIKGNLWLDSNAVLADFNGLNNLTSIGGELWIYRHFDLIDLEGLENLTYMPNDIIINYNNDLISLAGLNNITEIDKNLYILYNDDLTNFNGLNSLTTIGGEFTVEDNDKIENFMGLENLVSVGGTMWISRNFALNNYSGLNNLVSIGGDFVNYSNTTLASLTDLNNLNYLNGNLNLQYCDSITSLDGLDNLNAASINNIAFLNNRSLSTCAIKSICEYIGAPTGLTIFNNNAPGCNSLEEVDSACVYLSIGKVNFPLVFSVYPNPSSATINFSTLALPQKNTVITITDITGNQLIMCYMAEQQTAVDISGLVQGIYFVRMIDERMVQVGKFVKQ